MMAANLEATRGLIMAEAVSIALANHIGRQPAHELVEHACAQAVREGKHLREVLAGTRRKPDEVVGSTFTITNPGPFGSVMSVPIINLPPATPTPPTAAPVIAPSPAECCISTCANSGASANPTTDRPSSSNGSAPVNVTQHAVLAILPGLDRRRRLRADV